MRAGKKLRGSEIHTYIVQLALNTYYKYSA